MVSKRQSGVALPFTDRTASHAIWSDGIAGRPWDSKSLPSVVVVLRMVKLTGASSSAAPAADLSCITAPTPAASKIRRIRVRSAPSRASVAVTPKVDSAPLRSLSESDLTRKARIPLFKTFMGTDEITLPVYVGAMFDFHWNDHAGQIAKIRKANGMPAV